MDVWLYVLMHVCMHVRIAWMDGWMDGIGLGWINCGLTGWMQVCMYEYVNIWLNEHKT